uniref:Uncharacterized protein n=1 Tax=Neovison vison TaxID=452646 RepID=A0A8C7AVD3_NEOVI
MMKREISVCQQTWALLYKNLLKKWRLKTENIYSLGSNYTFHEFSDFSSLPAMDLGRVDSFKDSTFSLIYTPVTNTTQQIMNKVALASFMKAHCSETNENVSCEVSEYWTRGFVALQAAINAAIIETATNHSVMEELMSVTGKNMKIHPFVSQGGIEADFFIFFCIISFSSFTYYASLNVTRERKKMKGLMRMMGLRDSAFW